jgi:acid phosphatase (class A)
MMRKVSAVLSALFLILTSMAGPATAADDAEYRAKVAALGGYAGYLDPRALPDSAALLPPPPAPGSAEEARDVASAAASRKLEATPRWNLAQRDAELRGEPSVKSFACAAAVEITEKSTPATYRLLRRTLLDFGLGTYAAKQRYRRARPFMSNGSALCTPNDEQALRADGSYPSGHSAIGFGWGLVLAGLVPGRVDALMRRGIDFGDSRAVCNVHWTSDVEQGRVVAAAVFARLQAEPAFRSDFEAARAELSTAPAAAGCADPSSAKTD